MKLSKTNLISLAVFIGILAGFLFLIGMYTGLNSSFSSIILLSIFAFICTVSVATALLSEKMR